MSRNTFAHIDLKAVQHNLKQVRNLAPQQQILAMIKANAYGHGVLEVAKALSTAKVDGFGVAFIDEALLLRAAGIREPIVSLEGFYNADELRIAASQQIAVVIHHVSQIEILAQTALKQPLQVWLKIDTGMHRLGFLPEEVASAHQRLSAIKSVQKINLLTHFACPDEINNHYTREQFKLFNQLTEGYFGLRSLANSAAIMGWPQTRGEVVRPGIMLYGISPFADDEGANHNLLPVMTLQSTLIAIHSLKKGDAVGYGCTYTCPEDMPVGVVAIGYGDGYPRHAPTGTPVLVGDQIVSLIGRVSMDMITIDLRNHPKAQVGDTVTLWGKGLPLEDIAQLSGTIGYELLTQVTARVPRRYE